MPTGTDYDARRVTGHADDSLEEELTARHAKKDSASFDIDEAEPAEGYELPGAELLDEELTVIVIPIQADEFRCDQCFLVRHRSQRHQLGRNLCCDCA
jgi:hypothetical protein